MARYIGPKSRIARRLGEPIFGADKILSNKKILSWIVKYTVTEFADMDLERIEACIEGEPEVAKRS